MYFIETERLALRRICINDCTDFYDIFCCDDTMKYLGKTLTEDEVDGFINSILGDDVYPLVGNYAILNKSEDKVIGLFTFKYMKRDKKVDISFAINCNYWKFGYASELIKEVIKVLFTEYKMNKIIADCDVANVASVNLLKKMSFIEEGKLNKDRYSIRNRNYYDVILFGLLNEKNDL